MANKNAQVIQGAANGTPVPVSGFPGTQVVTVSGSVAISSISDTVNVQPVLAEQQTGNVGTVDDYQTVTEISEIFQAQCGIMITLVELDGSNGVTFLVLAEDPGLNYMGTLQLVNPQGGAQTNPVVVPAGGSVLCWVPQPMWIMGGILIQAKSTLSGMSGLAQASVIA